MNLRNLIKWSALFLAMMAYKQYEAAELNEVAEILDPDQNISWTRNQKR